MTKWLREKGIPIAWLMLAVLIIGTSVGLSLRPDVLAWGWW